MAEWRLFRGWSDEELEARLEAARGLEPSFPDDPDALLADDGWRHYYSEAVIAHEPPGEPLPAGAFERAWGAITRYEFSDPRIVTAHFDPEEELLGRRMLLELHVLGLRYLGGVRVGAVHAGGEGQAHGRTMYGFRYETLVGHIESGAEWFLLTKEHETGEVWFRIQAAWRPGQLPNWWSRLGFKLLVTRYQRAWHRLAYLRLRSLVDARGLRPLPEPGRLLHTGPEITAPPIQRFARKHASHRTLQQVGGERELREQESPSREV